MYILIMVAYCEVKRFAYCEVIKVHTMKFLMCTYYEVIKVYIL